jgi:FHS family glucose/mannose:H+ symporter-like MFS transporter
MRRDRVTLPPTSIAAMAVAFLLMGMVVAGYGPLLEHLTRRFAVSLPVAGATISVQFAGGLAGVLVSMRAIERMPARVTVAVSCVVAGAGLVFVALATAWPLFLFGVFVFGVGFGGLDLSVNQVVAYSEGRRQTAVLNALNSAYPAGAVAGPILVSAFAAEHFSTLFLVAAAGWLLLMPGVLGIGGSVPVAVAPSRWPGRLVAFFVVAFVLYVAMEVGTGGWMTSHLESRGFRSDSAAALTSGFWLALVIGRLFVALVPGTVGEARVVIASSAAATVALGLATVGALTPYAYIAAGLAMAPIFPTGIVWLAKLRPGDSRSTAWLYPAAAVGGAIGPGSIGLVIAGAGVGWTPVVVAGLALLMLVAFVAARRTAAP